MPANRGWLLWCSSFVEILPLLNTSFRPVTQLKGQRSGCCLFMCGYRGLQWLTKWCTKFYFGTLHGFIKYRHTWNDFKLVVLMYAPTKCHLHRACAVRSQRPGSQDQRIVYMAYTVKQLTTSNFVSSLCYSYPTPCDPVSYTTRPRSPGGAKGDLNLGLVLLDLVFIYLVVVMLLLAKWLVRNSGFCISEVIVIHCNKQLYLLITDSQQLINNR